MDFDMPQDAANTVYVCPSEDSKHALVECTRFGIEGIDEESARTHLDDYIKRNWGPYSIIEEEHGVIPMSTDLNSSTAAPSIIGSRLYWNTWWRRKTKYWLCIYIDVSTCSGYLSRSVGRYTHQNERTVRVL